MSKTMQELREEMRKEELEELEELSQSLNPITDTDVMLELDRFETYLLPFILKEIEHNDENTMVFIENFLSITESPRIGIKVIDKNKEVMFRLPGLVMNYENNLDDINLYLEVRKYNSYNKVNPREAARVINKTSKYIEDNIVADDNEEQEYKADLKKIFEYYKDRITNKEIKKEIIEDDTIIEEDFIEY